MMGVNQRATNIQKATVNPTMPVLPPSLMPVADSAQEQETRLSLSTPTLSPTESVLIRPAAAGHKTAKTAHDQQ